VQEWYDFLIYTFLGGVITKLFFPKNDVYAQVMGGAVDGFWVVLTK
jgi:hypothetical protein